MVAAPSIEDAHALDHDAYALWVFATPMLIAALIEAPLALLSDRVSRARLLAFGLLGFAAALVVAALAHRPWLLSVVWRSPEPPAASPVRARKAR